MTDDNGADMVLCGGHGYKNYKYGNYDNAGSVGSESSKGNYHFIIYIFCQ